MSIQILVLAGIPAATVVAIATGRLNLAGATVFLWVFWYLEWSGRLGRGR